MAETEKVGWEKLKAEGNAAYTSGNIQGAIEKYTAALQEEVPNDERAVILCNRAQCYLRLGQNSSVIEDCTACLTLQPSNIKALFRRAAAYEALEEHKEALRDYKAVLGLNPALSDASSGVQRCMNAIKSQITGGSANGPVQVSLTEEEKKQFEEVVGRVKEVQRNLIRAKEQVRSAADEKRRSELTVAQLDPVKDASEMYKGVGRMFLRSSKENLVKSLQEKVAAAEKKYGVASRYVEHCTQQAKEADEAFLELQASFRRKATAA